MFTNLNENKNGGYLNDNITLTQRNVEKGRIIQTLITSIHEIRHAYRNKQFKEYKENYDIKFYRMIKEKIIKENIMDFYNDNYFDMEEEFDARMYASMKTYEYLIEIGVPIDVIAEKEDYTIEEEIRNNINNNRKEKFYSINNKKKEKMDLNDIFMDIISGNNPYAFYMLGDREKYIETLLEKNPALKNEYKYSDDGRIIRKSEEEMRNELEEKLKTVTDENEKNKIRSFYRELLQEQPLELSDNEFIAFLEKNGYEISDIIRKRLQKEKKVEGNNEIMTGEFMEMARACYNESTIEDKNKMINEIQSLNRIKNNEKRDR